MSLLSAGSISLGSTFNGPLSTYQYHRKSKRCIGQVVCLVSNLKDGKSMYVDSLLDCQYAKEETSQTTTILKHTQSHSHPSIPPTIQLPSSIAHAESDYANSEIPEGLYINYPLIYMIYLKQSIRKVLGSYDRRKEVNKGAKKGFASVLRIRIRRIRMYFGLLDPDPNIIK
jgi:hypothetical protein